MTQIAQRMLEIKDYYFSEKLKEVSKLIQKGEKIVNFGIGSPDLLPHLSVIHALEQALLNNKSYMYSPYNGINELRYAISKWYKKEYNVDIDPDCEVIPLSGSKEGINFISLGYLSKGDKVLVPNPSYPVYSTASVIAGAEVTYYNLTESNNWIADIDELEHIIDNRCKILFANYPHMPSGQNATKSTLEMLVRFAFKHNIIICFDNPYSFILNNKPTSILSIDGAKEVCIELNSLSKTFNMAGARVGMMLGKKELLSAPSKIHNNFSSGIFYPIQHASIQALSLDRTWVECLNNTYLIRKKLLKKLLKLLNCEFSTKTTGLFIWAKIPEYFKNGESFSDFLLNEYGIFATPGIVFGTNGNSYIRFSLCVDETTIENTIQNVKKNKLKIKND